jgi:hypothetical protein
MKGEIVVDLLIPPYVGRIDELRIMRKTFRRFLQIMRAQSPEGLIPDLATTKVKRRTKQGSVYMSFLTLVENDDEKGFDLGPLMSCVANGGAKPEDCIWEHGWDISGINPGKTRSPLKR